MKKHTCDCGFTWRHGHSGAHSCEPYYRKTIAELRAAAAPQVVADDLDMQMIRERDYNAEMADKLADGIAEHFGADIGEHSSANCPWVQALYLLNTKPEFIYCAGSKRAAAPVQASNPVEFDGIKTDAVKAQEPIGYAPSYLTERMAAGDSAVMLTVTRKPLPGHGVTVALYTAPVQPVAVPEALRLLSILFDSWENGISCQESYDGASIGNAFKLSDEDFHACVKVLEGTPRAAPAAQGDASQAAVDVLAERRRQIDVEGRTPDSDDRRTDCELARAAATYALCTEPEQLKLQGVTVWPWNRYWWKFTNYRRNLVKSGALIVAEIERIDRAAIAAKAAS